MGRQLNIRSDEAFDAAHKIADNLGITTTKAVELALNEMLSHSKIEYFKDEISEQESRKIFDSLTAAAKACTAAARPGASSDHSYLYDENGLPI
jgi:antitoxin VapB